jgi:hypothetical protein
MVAAYLMVDGASIVSKTFTFAHGSVPLDCHFRAMFGAIWFFSKPVLVLALTYMFSGVFWRCSGYFGLGGIPASTHGASQTAEFECQNWRRSAVDRLAAFTALRSSVRHR